MIRGTSDAGSKHVAVNARWWLTPNWAKEISTKYSMFNARSETLEKSPAFKTPFRRKRCAVPISGYYEWQRLQDGKQPHYIKPAENAALMLAGLWDEWQNTEVDEVLTSFTIVTCDVADTFKFLHHGQPMMLDERALSTWSNHETDIASLRTLVQPKLPVPLEIVPVSNFVGNSKNNGPRCIEPVGSSHHIGLRT